MASDHRTAPNTMDSSQSPLQGLWKPTPLSALYYGPTIVSSHLLSALATPESKAFILTGNSLTTRTPLIKDVESLLGARHAGTFSSIKQHAPVADIDTATSQVLSSGADTIISIGGGSPIDAAKLISYRHHERTGRYLHHVTIPTTLSAAECSPNAGYTSASGQKTGVAAPALAPAVILYDASFLRHTPVHLVLSTGLRALDHALETLYHPTASDLTQGMACLAAGALVRDLPRYKADPSDATLAGKLQLAAFGSLGYLGLNVRGGLGLSHTLGYALGSPYGIPHGVTSCLTLGKTVALRARMDRAAAEGVARACGFVGVAATGDVVADAVAVGAKVEDLVGQLGLRTDLGKLGVGRDQVPVIAKAVTRTESGELYDRVTELVESLWEEDRGKM